MGDVAVDGEVREKGRHVGLSRRLGVSGLASAVAVKKAVASDPLHVRFLGLVPELPKPGRGAGCVEECRHGAVGVADAVCTHHALTAAPLTLQWRNPPLTAAAARRRRTGSTADP